MRYKIVIDGTHFSNLDEFYSEMEQLLTKDLTWKTGRNMDAFHDLLRGGFGKHEVGECIDFYWIYSNKSRQDLGYEETFLYWKKIFQKCHSSNCEKIKKKMEDAKKQIGKTLFDMIVEEILNKSDWYEHTLRFDDEHYETNLELPIPSHLRNYFVLYGADDSENQVSGKIRCSCNGETFSVFSSNDGGIVTLICDNCQKEILLFDAGKHGWNGFVCKDDFLDRTEPLEEHVCPVCGKKSFAISVCISSQGKDDFLEECVENDDAFVIEDWIDGFEWIQISLSCSICKSSENAWVDYETM